MLLRLLIGGLRAPIAVIAVVVALVAAPNAPQAQNALKTQIDDVKNKLSQDSLRDPEIKRAVDELLVNVLRLPGAIEKEATLSAAIAAASGYLDGKTAQNPVQVMNDTNLMVGNVAAAISRVPLDQLSAGQRSNLTTAAAATTDSSLSIERRLDVTATAIHLAAQLTAIIKDPKFEKKSPAFATAKDQLESALLQLDPRDPRVNILGAWYGDVAVIKRVMPRNAAKMDFWRDGRRFCSATRVVRTRCQGNYNCSFPGSTSGQQQDDVTSANLCGIDQIAPFASDQTKGLVVYYQCVTAGPEVWRFAGVGDPKELAEAPASTSTGQKSVAPPIQDAVLRKSGKTEFRCQDHNPTPKEQ